MRNGISHLEIFRFYLSFVVNNSHPLHTGSTFIDSNSPAAGVACRWLADFTEISKDADR